MYCNTLSNPQAFLSAIQKWYCNTIYFFLQFFQPSLLQYNCKACNTNSQYNLGNGPKPFLHFLSRIFFLKLLENHLKIIFIHFLHFLSPSLQLSFFLNSNKFIKIYFHSFFFNFTHCKTLRKIFLLIIFFSHFQPLENTKKFICLFFFSFPIILK